jgi:hypothetical protein
VPGPARATAVATLVVDERLGAAGRDRV